METNYFVNVKASLLNTLLEGTVYSENKVVKSQGTDMNVQTRMVLIKPQEAAPTGSVTISDFMEKIGVDKSVIETIFGSGEGETPKSINIKLSMAYLRYIKQITQQVGTQEQGNEKVTKEYAFKVEITEFDSLKIFELIYDILEIKGATLAIWNTNDAEVKEQMKLELPAIPDLLPQPAV